ncbi:hypothetical protein GF322_04020 [Candidatus Dependentiae bacterium]|nr:hypothetical protein [Candidatus Dependentiae bacterium]
MKKKTFFVVAIFTFLFVKSYAVDTYAKLINKTNFFVVCKIYVQNKSGINNMKEYEIIPNAYRFERFDFDTKINKMLVIFKVKERRVVGPRYDIIYKVIARLELKNLNISMRPFISKEFPLKIIFSSIGTKRFTAQVGDKKVSKKKK